jgi:hypothetical protein
MATDRVPTSRVATGVVTESDKPPRGYYDRKAEGWCVYGACPRRAQDWPEVTHHYCKRHRVKVQAKQSKRVALVRAEAVDQGKCRRCRKPSETYRCPACAILDDTKLPTSRVATGVVTATDPWRRDKDGWERYRGKGKRGAPPAALNDEADLRRAFEALERGRNAIAYARSAAVAELPRIQKQDALAAAASILAMSAQFTLSVVERNRVPDPRVVGARAQVREALGAGVDPEMLDDALIDRVIAAVRRAA